MNGVVGLDNFSIEYKNGMNKWAEYWDDPSREDELCPKVGDGVIRRRFEVA